MTCRLLAPAIALLLAITTSACSDEGARAVEPSADRQAVVSIATRWVIDTPQAIIASRAIGAVDILDHFASGPFLSGGPDGLPFTDAERQSVEDALRPVPVRWVSEAGAMCLSRTGTDPDITIDPRTAMATVPARVTLLLAVPHLDGDRATVRLEIWCAACCRSGTTLELSRRPTGEWAVDRTVGGFIS